MYDKYYSLHEFIAVKTLEGIGRENLYGLTGKERVDLKEVCLSCTQNWAALVKEASNLPEGMAVSLGTENSTIKGILLTRSRNVDYLKQLRSDLSAQGIQVDVLEPDPVHGEGIDAYRTVIEMAAYLIVDLNLGTSSEQIKLIYALTAYGFQMRLPIIFLRNGPKISERWMQEIIETDPYNVFDFSDEEKVLIVSKTCIIRIKEILKRPGFRSNNAIRKGGV